MSRSRKVTPESAIQAAQALFWKHGYCSLGTRQIEEETGLTRFTLQTSYGGKKALFLKTLDAYLAEFETMISAPDITSGLDGLATWFTTRANPQKMPDVGRYGCLMLNSIVEFQGQDAEINTRSDRYFSLLRDSFRLALSNARTDNKLSHDFDIEGKADTLLGVILGMNIIIRAADDNVAAAPMGKATAAMIRAWS